MDINRDQRMLVDRQARGSAWRRCGQERSGSSGLAFKPNTDDMREAPSIDIAKRPARSRRQVRAYDPAAMERAQAHPAGHRATCDDAYEVADGRRRAGAGHGVERVPASRPRPAEGFDAQAGAGRRTQHLRPGGHAAARLRRIAASAATEPAAATGRAPWSPGAPASSAPTSASRLLGRGCEVLALDNLLTGIARQHAHLAGNPASRSPGTT